MAQALDVWLAFESDEDDEPQYEANTYPDEDGEFVIEWYHTAVGLVSRVYFDTYQECEAWYEANGYQNFTA